MGQDSHINITGILVGELELNPVKENNLDDQDLFSDPFSKKITLAEWNLWVIRILALRPEHPKHW